MESGKKVKKPSTKKPKKEIIVDSSEGAIKNIYELESEFEKMKIDDVKPIDDNMLIDVVEHKPKRGCPECGFVKATKPKAKRPRKCNLCSCTYETTPQEHRESPRHLAISLLISKIADSDDKQIVQMMDKI
jgi:hypothetical protein